MGRTVVGLALLVLVAASASAQIPQTISYQGVLTDLEGNPVADGTYSLTFRLYEQAEGGTAVWEETHASVTVTDGVFGVLLGSVEPLALTFDRPYWLGIVVDGGAELTPRVALASVPYSLMAAGVAEGGAVQSLNGLRNAVELVAGENVTIEVNGQQIRIGTNGGGNGGETDEAWRLTGNAGTTPGTHFVGTTDAVPLELKVNGARALRLEPTTGTPNVIGGHGDNAVTDGVVGAAIGGGGAPGNAAYNVVTDDYGTIGGGQGNRAGNDAGTTDDQRFATVGGGKGNTAARVAATVAGGNANRATGNYATVAGGRENDAAASYATVGGGRNNQVLAAYGTIAGGGPADPNDATGTNNRVFDEYGTIGGGARNEAGSDDNNHTSSPYATVGGGYGNTASGGHATVGGGATNNATGSHATVAGGSGNTASGDNATVGGGLNNIASASAAVVGGGRWNRAKGGRATVAGGDGNVAIGSRATVAGGKSNTASGDFSVVAGGMNNTAEGGQSTVGGGENNTASGGYATVGGGKNNTASAEGAVVGGGVGNTASGRYATVPGGFGNVARGEFSFAAGSGAIVDNQHAGTFVWSGTLYGFASTGSGQFLVNAPGGVGLGTNEPKAQLHVREAVNGTGTLANHVAIIENDAADASNGPDVLALKSSAVNPSGSTNFITFFDGNEQNIGRIEGNGSGGVVYGTTGGDYAEALPLLSPDEPVETGDIVGVVAGRVTRRTAGAHRVMVITGRPAVLGNLPPEDQAEGYVPVAFVGQVPVKVWGPVHAGDYILPSGREDGTGVAVAPEALAPEDASRVVGQAWEDAPDPGLHRVNVLVGLDSRDVLIARQQAELERLAAEVARLQALVESLLRQRVQPQATR